jgi:hypothetical protein
MASGQPRTLYVQVVQITSVYLGPAADRFIARQVESHLHKLPEKLSKTDLLALIAWIRLAMSILTDDTDIVDEYVQQLQELAKPQPGNRK